MITAEAIHLFSLVGLRALADYDPIEFRRTTDLSKRQLDDRLNDMLIKLKRESPDEVREIEGRLQEMRSIEMDAEGQNELTFLLRQLSIASLQKAQQLALSYSRTSIASPREKVTNLGDSSLPERNISIKRGEEYIRLGVMRIIRELPEYKPHFEYRYRNRYIDCMLEPQVGEMPIILIEGTFTLNSLIKARADLQKLKSVTSGWGKNVVNVLLTSTIAEEVFLHLKKVDSRLIVLVYDVEVNEFTDQSFVAFKNAVYGKL